MPKNEDKELRATMTELVHRCIKCEHVAYEIEEGHYLCPSCKFEWEVV